MQVNKSCLSAFHHQLQTHKRMVQGVDGLGVKIKRYMEEEEKENLTRDAEKIWEDPEKIMHLIDILFLWEDTDKRQVCS